MRNLFTAVHLSLEPVPDRYIILLTDANLGCGRLCKSLGMKRIPKLLDLSLREDGTPPVGLGR